MRKLKGSYTIEAAILIPIVLFMLMSVLQLGIGFYQESVNRDVYEGLNTLDIVSEFYYYQVLKDVGEEVKDD